MVAFLLCAGFGTRMRPRTSDTPKSLLDLGGQPILDYLMEDLQEWTDLDAVHIAVNHRHADTFRGWATNWQSALTPEGVTLHVHDDGVVAPDEQLGAVGDLQFLLAQTTIPTRGALVCGGDSLYRFRLSPILNAFDGTTNRILALHEPDPVQQRQSTCLQLEGSRVTGLADSATAPHSGRICPSWYLLTSNALSMVSPYLSNGGDPDTLGTFIDALTTKMTVNAIRMPEMKDLRFHCNTPADLNTARDRLEREPRLLLDTDDVTACLQADGMIADGSDDG